MYSKILVAAVILFSFDVANALMCYNCTQTLNPSCGETIGDANGIQQVSCSGSCAIAKSTATFAGNEVTVYDRTCIDICVEQCIEFESIGVKSCIVECCKTDLCNDESNTASGGVVNLVPVLFTLLFCTAMS